MRLKSQAARTIIWQTGQQKFTLELYDIFIYLNYLRKLQERIKTPQYA